MNVCCFTGRVTKDIELKTTQSGASVCSFTIAVDRSFQKAGEERKADFINIVAWRNEAEFISKYFGKGDMIAITGELNSRKYTGNDGGERIVWEVVASKASFCGSKNSAPKEQSQFPTPPSMKAQTENVSDDDLPF